MHAFAASYTNIPEVPLHKSHVSLAARMRQKKNRHGPLVITKVTGGRPLAQR